MREKKTTTKNTGDNMEKLLIDHSLKDIPIPSNHAYILKLTEKIEDVIARIRWKTYFFLNGESNTKEKNNYGFKSQKTPPRNKLLENFEQDLLDIINKIKFRRITDNFQKKLADEVKEIKNSKQILVRADKTTNIYKIDPTDYEKMLGNNIHNKYKIDTNNNNEYIINKEAKRITDHLKISDRVGKLQRSNAYILLKDHKSNFDNKPTARLINPTKTEIGKISKRILEKINERTKKFYGLNQWINTKEALQWFEAITGKENAVFVQFDIVDYYPSITLETLENALVMAGTCNSISTTEIDIIKQCRKTVLFNNQTQWIKSNGPNFDVAMGAYDSAQIADLVGLYILYNLTNSNNIDIRDIGLYRDDGLLVLKNCNGHKVDSIKKEITKKFRQMGFKIDIKANVKIVNFLDVTLNLNEKTYENYSKPNNTPLYVNTLSNHPLSVLKQIPRSINFRLRQNSSNRKVFQKHTPEYDKALKRSGYKGYELKYEQEQVTNNNRKNRPRNVIWFTPPFNKKVKTNVGKLFISIIKKHFPRNSKLHKILNNNNIKLGYSCMNSIGKIIKNHNNRIKREMIKQNTDKNARECNCIRPEECVLRNKCLTKEIVYMAKISTKEDPNEEKIYFGISKPEFKARLANHRRSFTNKDKKTDTALSKYYWSLKEKHKTPQITWRLVKTAKVCNSLNSRCNLCLEEKVNIVSYKNKWKLLNSRSEIGVRCIHNKAHTLSNLKTIV